MKNIIAEKSYGFALKVISLYKYLCERKGFVLSKQFLRCGTAIGALVKEAEYAQSKSDFLNKMNIALKEANEAEYWLMLLKDSGYITVETFRPYQKDCSEILSILASIVKSTKASLKNKR